MSRLLFLLIPGTNVHKCILEPDRFVRSALKVTSKTFKTGSEEMKVTRMRQTFYVDVNVQQEGT